MSRHMVALTGPQIRALLDAAGQAIEAIDQNGAASIGMTDAEARALVNARGLLAVAVREGR